MKGSIAELGYLTKDNFLALRILAAVLVIYGHSFAVTQPNGEIDLLLKLNWGRYSGDFAVAIFFVISGFMVTGSYLRRDNFIGFIQARLLRIVPAYLVVIIGSVIFIGPSVTTLTLREYYSSPETIAYFIQNITFWSDLSWLLPGVFEGQPYVVVNGSLWTIPAEFRMYIVVGVLGVMGLLARRYVATPILVIAFVFSIYDPTLFSKNVDAVRIGGYFCLGIIAQLYKNEIAIRHEFMLLLIVLCFFSRHSIFYFYILASTIAYFCFWFAFKLGHIDIEKFGDPSYGIYLWGWPMQQLIVNSVPTVTPYINAAIAIPAAMLLGYISWHLIEAKFLSFKKSVKVETVT